MESQQQVPPGIVAFTHDGDIFHRYNSVKYEDWVKANLEVGHIIDTISVDGKEYSVKQMVCETFNHKEIVEISEFKWVFDEWSVTCIRKDGSECKYCLSELSKLPPPSQPKPNYERLEEMLDRSVSQPGGEDWKPTVWEEMYWILNAEFEDYKAKQLPPKENPNIYSGKRMTEIKEYWDMPAYIPPQPSQPVQGKEELVTEHGMICNGLNAAEEFELRNIFESVRDERNLYRNKFEELAALKCKPTDGWSDEQVATFVEWVDKYFENYGHTDYFTWSKQYPSQNTMISVNTIGLIKLYRKYPDASKIPFNHKINP